jgi:hypothetical protein
MMEPALSTSISARVRWAVHPGSMVTCGEWIPERRRGERLETQPPPLRLTQAPSGLRAGAPPSSERTDRGARAQVFLDYRGEVA